MTSLKDKTIVITGASRGIGAAIAIRAARDGANIAILAKSDTPHPTLEGTIHTTADAVEKAGGRALPLSVDIRDENAVAGAIQTIAATFGQIDMVVNNASAIHAAPTPHTPMSKYDLMMDVNARGTFAVVQAALPHLQKSATADSPAQILTLSPPLNLGSQWIGRCPAYSLSKYGMSLLTMGFAAEFKDWHIHANTLWPQTLIATDAVRVFFADAYNASRTPEIVAEAAYAILTGCNGRFETGQHYTDESALRLVGINDFSKYNTTPGLDPVDDIFLD